MIIVTGTAGFIGSCMVQRLLDDDFQEIVSVDDFSISTKERNFLTKPVVQKINRQDLLKWLPQQSNSITAIIHLGARTDTTEQSWTTLLELNLEYTKALWSFCTEQKIPFIYASSAATYGDGSNGYNDDHASIPKLEPLNLYGKSKNEFDKWAIAQEKQPPFWAGLKFFNVYGPNEYHKARMASVILHAFTQINETGKVKLFRSHHKAYKDGMQLRDFIYVKDLTSIIRFLMQEQPNSGIYNVGTGKARSFYDLAVATFHAMNRPVDIEFIDMPMDIREKYQYFTEANMDKIKQNGYKNSFYSLEDGVMEYVQEYLIPNKTY